MHAHTNDHRGNEKALKSAFLIIFLFMIVEAIGGVVSGSLALLADAGHMLTDAAALGMAWLAFVAGRRPPDGAHSYGHQRYQVLAAFVNGLLLVLIVVWILLEAIERFQNPNQINVTVMLSVATVGLAVNLITFKMLHGGEKSNLNIRGAMLHVLSDLLGSVAAIIAGVVIYFYGWLWIDPALSLIVAGLIVRSGSFLIKDSMHILLEGVPKHIDVDAVKHHLESLDPAIENVHHIHTWSLNNEEVLMTLHLKMTRIDNVDQLLKQLHLELESKFNITHATIQIEKNYCSSQLEQF